MAEYILREQAIRAVTGAKLPDVSASGLPIANGKRSVTDCVRRLKEIPAADVRPVVRGKWRFEIGDGKTCVDGWVCSACNCGFHTNVPYFEGFNFCPNCGADMREES